MERKMDDLYSASKIAFASTFSFYLKAHNFHWNVEGSDFLEYHDLFGKIYDEVYESIDNFAEKMRGVGTYVPASLSRFNMLTQIQDETEVIPKDQMVIELLSDNEKLIKILKMVYDIAESQGEHGFSSFLADRMDAHRKHSWMLRASTKGQ
jgi:starvation-inducible DNA-binding protein